MLRSPNSLSLSLMLSFYRTKVESIDQVKSNLSLIFHNAAILLQTNNPKSAQNNEKSSSYKYVLKNSCELFPLATTHAKVANSSKMVIARYHIRYSFQERTALTLSLLEN